MNFCIDNIIVGCTSVAKSTTETKNYYQHHIAQDNFL